MKTVKHYINGTSTASSQDYLPVIDPSNGEQVANVTLANSNDFNNLIKSSVKSQVEW